MLSERLSFQQRKEIKLAISLPIQKSTNIKLDFKRLNNSWFLTISTDLQIYTNRKVARG